MSSIDMMVVQNEVSHHMEQITKAFKPGVKIAVLIRTPEHPDRDFMMTDDDLSELIKMLERQKDRELHTEPQGVEA